MVSQSCFLKHKYDKRPALWTFDFTNFKCRDNKIIPSSDNKRLKLTVSNSISSSHQCQSISNDDKDDASEDDSRDSRSNDSDNSIFKIQTYDNSFYENMVEYSTPEDPLLINSPFDSSIYDPNFSYMKLLSETNEEVTDECLFIVQQSSFS